MQDGVKRFLPTIRRQSFTTNASSSYKQRQFAENTELIYTEFMLLWLKTLRLFHLLIDCLNKLMTQLY